MRKGRERKDHSREPKSSAMEAEEPRALKWRETLVREQECMYVWRDRTKEDKDAWGV
jgi:hypothetical protein